MGFPSSSISPINFMHRPNKELLSVALLQQSHPKHTHAASFDLYASLKGHVTLPTRCRALKLEPRGGEAHRYPPVAKATPTEETRACLWLTNKRLNPSQTSSPVFILLLLH